MVDFGLYISHLPFNQLKSIQKNLKLYRRPLHRTDFRFGFTPAGADIHIGKRRRIDLVELFEVVWGHFAHDDVGAAGEDVLLLRAVQIGRAHV